MDINFADYLSDDERKQIISDVFRGKCEEAFDKDAERIFSNAAYHIVWEFIDQKHDGKVAEIIAEKAKSVIADLSAYSVFRAKDYWNQKESKGYAVLMDAIENSRPQVQERISVLVNEIEENDMRDFLKDVAADLLEDRLFPAKKEATK